MPSQVPYVHYEVPYVHYEVPYLSHPRSASRRAFFSQMHLRVSDSKNGARLEWWVKSLHKDLYH